MEEKENLGKSHTWGWDLSFSCVSVYKSAFGVLAFMYTMWYDSASIQTALHSVKAPSKERKEDYDIF